MFYTSADIYSSISYPSPTIKDLSLRRYDGPTAGWTIPPSGEPLYNKDINGEILTFFGSRLVVGGRMYITYGSTAGEFKCSVRPLPAPLLPTDIPTQITGTGSNISCVSESGASGENLRFFVSIAGATIPGVDHYNYRAAPRVVAIQATTIGNTDIEPSTNCQSSTDGTRVFNCPTTGYVFIIVSIGSYQDGTLKIQIAGSICEIASAVVYNNATSVYDVLCLLPPGVGQNQPVSVSITTQTGILFGPANTSLSYAPPVIDQVIAFSTIAPDQIGGDSSHSLAWYVNQTLGAVKNIVTAQIQRNDLIAQAIAHGANQSEIDSIRVMPEPYGESQQVVGGCASSVTSSSLSIVVVSGCPRNSSSPIILRITGKNFGQNNANVFIGSSPCLSVLHSPGNEHSELFCVLPNGKGLFAPLVVLQNNGLPSSSTRKNSKGEIEIPSVSYAQCNPGTFDNVFEPSTLTCQPCPIGTYADAEGSYSCTPCPPGSYTSSSSSRLCTLCGRGTYQDQFGASSCFPCANGTYAATEGQPRCSPCTKGTARSSPGGSFCDSCPSGTEQGAEGGTSCNACEVGYANPNPGRPACEVCPAGKFASSTGKFTCDECPLGFYQSLSGKSFCSACSPGKFASQSARLQCTDCPAGMYSNTYGSSTCTPCPIFSHQNSTGQTSCIACLPQLGQFTDKIGEADCTNCTRGLYRLPSGTCIPCPIGADCYNGLVLAQENYYLVQDPVSGIVTAHQCLPGYCEACNVEAEQKRIDALREQFSLRITVDNANDAANAAVPTTTPTTETPTTGRPNITSIPSYITSTALNDMVLTSVVSKCTSNREDAANNTLCGKCIQGYVEWGGKCISCTATHWGIVTGLFFVAWCYVLLIHFLSQSASSDSKIFLYYAQMVLLFSAGTDHFSWISVLQFNLLNTSAQMCISPLSGMEKLLGGIVIPILCMGLLCVTAIIHFGVNAATRKYITPQRYPWLPRQPKWNANPFIRTACALFLFSYNSIADTTLRYFNCKKVGDHTVVASQPSITCYHGDHARFGPLFWFFVAVVVCAGPVLMLVSLIAAHRRHLLQRPLTLARFGIIYETYRDSRRPYWEFIVITRRVILITLTVVLSYSRVTMYSWLTFLNILFLLLHMVFLPYQTNMDNVLETISLVLLGLMTAFLCGTGSQLTPGEDWGLIILVYVPGGAFLSTLIWLRYQRIRAAVSKRGKQIPDKEMDEINPVVESLARRGTSSHSDKAMKMQIMKPLPDGAYMDHQTNNIASPTVTNTPHNATTAAGSEIEMEGVALQVITSHDLPGRTGTGTFISPLNPPHLSDRVLHTNHPFTSHNSLAALEMSHHSHESNSGGVSGKWSRRVTEGVDEQEQVAGETPVAIAGLKFMS